MLIRKTDRFSKRKTRIYDYGTGRNETVMETYQRETWWLLWVIPLYSRDTVIDKPDIQNRIEDMKNSHQLPRWVVTLSSWILVALGLGAIARLGVELYKFGWSLFGVY